MIAVDELSHAERGCRVRKSRTMLRPPKNTILMTGWWTRSYEALLLTYENCIECRMNKQALTIFAVKPRRLTAKMN